MDEIYTHLKGQIFHSTGIYNLQKIVADGFIKPASSDSACGFCQHTSGVASEVGPTISLSDLTISSEEQIIPNGTHWRGQVWNPWGADINSNLKTTIIS